ncbi:mannitol-1-phosphate 5-dehydrogenase [Caldicoprobacter guelmensis]|uniref:mannitol dehydrogenase family protein n=1 Tax=Caldicoprobacter guelmensis TaxID=1170224 RepID=UPI00195861D9|nr:mannitol dehydrogenase [Caldicoprobacter guelmensis]MBM7581695.1 mannitol-1-phosphate 5-dehydrogenase [Caldicoprobacter guelmensis]
MKKAIVYGGGNVGRGFIGQLFSESGYEVVFVDINLTIIERLNKDRSYPIRIVEDERYTEVVVENVRGVYAGDIERVAEEIASADIMATAVGVNVLPNIVKTIAMGLKKKWLEGNFKPLNIIICENLLDADRYLAKLIKQELNEKEIVYFDNTIGLVEASIGRMIPVITKEMQEGNPLRVWVEPYCELPVDKASFKGEIPEIKNMVPFAPFDFYIQRKLFMHNMGHAVVAYLGFLCNKTYIWESVKVPEIKLIALRALIDSAAALSSEYSVPMQQLVNHAEDLLYRFGNKLLGDTVKRVGRDPLRKLSRNDRLVGAARLCSKQGINPVYMALGIAAGIKFAFETKDDIASQNLYLLQEKNYIDNLLEGLCGLVDDLMPVAQMVKEFYSMIQVGCNLDELLSKAEKLKRMNLTKVGGIHREAVR